MGLDPLLILAPGSSLSYSEILILLGLHKILVPLQFGDQNVNKTHICLFALFISLPSYQTSVSQYAGTSFGLAIHT